MQYKQCILEKSQYQQTAWIPKHLAITGKLLTIKDDPGWVVVYVANTAQEYASVNEDSRDYARMRKYSDI